MLWALLGCCSPVFAAPDFSQADADVVRLEATLSFVRNNSVISNPSSVVSHGVDGVLLIDTGIEETQAVLIDALRTIAGDRMPRFVINTHFHADHAGGNARFADACLLAHQGTRDLLAHRGLRGHAVPQVALPELVTTGGLTLHFNGEPVRLIALGEGHTQGDLAVLFEHSRVLVAGDYYFYNTFPIIDLEHGGSIAGYLANVRTLLALAPPGTRVVPGHSTLAPAAPVVADLDAYRRWYEVVEGAISTVGRLKRAGMALDDIEVHPELAPLDGFVPLFYDKARWIRALHAAMGPDGVPGR